MTQACLDILIINSVLSFEHEARQKKNKIPEDKLRILFLLNTH